MNPPEKPYLQIVEHYEECLRRHGDTCRGVDWPNSEDADTRYRVMTELIDARAGIDVTLLDFGCGAAHLRDYLLRRGIDGIVYSGLDLSPKFVELCRRKHPETPFYCCDVLATSNATPVHDYVVMNGVFTEKRGLSQESMFEYFARLVVRTFDLARIGLAFNVMSKHVDWERPDLFYVSFDGMADFLCRNVSRNFVFRNDYGLYEYTAYVFREPASRGHDPGQKV